MKTFASFLFVLALLGLPSALAQSGPMDTCQTARDCDAAAERLVAQAQSVLASGRHHEAAQVLYPVVLNTRITPQTKADAANTFSDLLASAGLYIHAAGQKANANAVTRAPASEDELAYARLLAKAGEEELALEAYAHVAEVVVASANLKTLGALISDYRRLGQNGLAGALEAQRAEITARADARCAAVLCRSRAVIDAGIQTLGPVEYPREARRRGRGECRVTLNVTEAGEPVDLTPDCTDPVFIEAAMIAVQQSEFNARFENGTPRPRYNIVLPFAFEPG